MKLLSLLLPLSVMLTLLPATASSAEVSSRPLPDAPHLYCYRDDGRLACADQPPRVAGLVASFDLFDLTYYRGAAFSYYDVPGGCVHVTDFHPADLGFMNNRASSVRVLDPQCRLAGWDVDVMNGDFERCYTQGFDVNVYCPDLGVSVAGAFVNWNDRISGIRWEPSI